MLSYSLAVLEIVKSYIRFYDLHKFSGTSNVMSVKRLPEGFVIIHKTNFVFQFAASIH